MRCKVILSELLALTIDGKSDAIPEAYQNHLDTCEECRKEWRKIQGWVEALQPEEEWIPDEKFYDRLVETAVRESHRAALTESTRLDLQLESSSWKNIFYRPLSIPRFALGALLVVVLLPALWFSYHEMQTVGNFDYHSGAVIAFGAAPVHLEKGAEITKQTSIQTARDAESILNLEGGAEISIGSQSDVVIENARTVRINRGRVFFNIAKGKGKFRALLPEGEALVLGTSFAVDVEQGQSVVTVLEGLVQVSNGNQQTLVKPGFEGILKHQSCPIAQQAQRIKATARWISALKIRRNKEELRTYFPSLAAPEKKNEAP